MLQKVSDDQENRVHKYLRKGSMWDVVLIVFSMRRVTEVLAMDSIAPDTGSNGIVLCSMPYSCNSVVAKASASILSWEGRGIKCFFVD